jgi:hypothetical protein
VTPLQVTPRETASTAAFLWQDYSRFVSVAAVDRGWLVLWGRWHDLGRRRELVGERTYLDLAGARRRLADSVLELTGDFALVAEATARFDRTPFPRELQPTAHDRLTSTVEHRHDPR